MASTFNQIFYSAPGKLVQVNDNTNEFIISGYRLVVDKNLNRDLMIVETPSNTGDYGLRGNIAFDNNHIYYCRNTNDWLRGRLARWKGNDNDVFVNVPSPVNITNPTNWWKLQSPFQNLPNGQRYVNPDLGSYIFIDVASANNNIWWSAPKAFGGPGNPPLPSAFFSTVSGYLNYPNGNNYNSASLLNYGSNLVDLISFNQDFSISFETRRIPNTSSLSTMILGSLYGALGFHFRFANKSNLTSGNYLSGQNIVFGLSAHTTGTQVYFGSNPAYNTDIYWARPNFPSNGNRWINVASNSNISTGTLTQIVATNNATTKEIKLYVNGNLEDSKSYQGVPLAVPRAVSKESQAIGMAIGATPVGGISSTDFTDVSIYGGTSFYVTQVSNVQVKNLGFWKNKILTQEEITNLYNNGDFRSYPFV